MRDRETKRGRDTGRGRSRLQCKEPNAGLDPRSPGSGSGLKAALNCSATLGLTLKFYITDKSQLSKL